MEYGLARNNFRQSIFTLKNQIEPNQIPTNVFLGNLVISRKLIPVNVNLTTLFIFKKVLIVALSNVLQTVFQGERF